MSESGKSRRRGAGSEEGVGVGSRRAAMRLLDAVLRKGLPLEAALDGAAADLDRPDDRAFAHAIAAETLRRLADIDALIDRFVPKRLPDDAKARFALRIALVQALAMGTAPHAAIATILPLLDGGPKRLVHGAFGAILRSGATLPEVPELPALFAVRWSHAWGPEMAAAAARAIAAPPPIDLTLKGEVPAGLSGMSLLPGHLRLDVTGPVTALPGYTEGAWWVQDVAASLPARLLGPGEGRTALDLCAAPGGKTMQLVAAGFQVTAVELSQSRLGRLSDNLQRTGLSAELVAGNVMQWEPPEPVDAILLDAPCSATGIFRRHPDVLHRVRPAAIAELATLQRAMLARATSWLKPGGTIVYAVCSLERAEGEDVVADPPAELVPDPIDAAGLSPELVPDAHTLRILPGIWADQGGADGFFMARFRKV